MRLSSTACDLVAESRGTCAKGVKQLWRSRLRSTGTWLNVLNQGTEGSVWTGTLPFDREESWTGRSVARRYGGTACFRSQQHGAENSLGCTGGMNHGLTPLRLRHVRYQRRPQVAQEKALVLQARFLAGC